MIRFYMGGTTDAKDGIEISSGDMLNPIIADGFYPAIGSTISKTINLHIRADAGEIWHDVILGVIDTNNIDNLGNSFNFLLIGSNNISFTQLSQYKGIQIPWFATLGDINKPLALTVSASGSDTNTPDTSCKLVAFNGFMEV